VPDGRKFRPPTNGTRPLKIRDPVADFTGMDLSGVSPEAAVMAVAQTANAAQYAAAVMAKTQRVHKEEGQALVSLIQNAAPKEGVGQRLSVFA